MYRKRGRVLKKLDALKVKIHGVDQELDKIRGAGLLSGVESITQRLRAMKEKELENRVIYVSDELAVYIRRYNVFNSKYKKLEIMLGVN